MRRALAPLALAVALTGACSSGEASTPPPAAAGGDLEDTGGAGEATTTTPTSTAAPTTTTTEPPHPPAPSGRTYPAVPTDAEAAATRLYAVEAELRRLDPSTPGWADLAHEQQMLYRVIGRTPDWIPAVFDGAPDDLRAAVGRHLAARRAIAGIGHGTGEPPRNVPAWQIIDPLPLDELEVLYRQAETDSGIEWVFLAAINFIETGFGRIDGISTAGAQGPMQFLPTTWEEVSDGDIRDPADAIPAAARYLVRRGGPEDMHRALWGYNNSDSYVAAVTHYATLFRTDRRALEAAHAWEIHYSAAAGDLWFPVGYREQEPRPVVEYLLDAPWSAPPPT